MIGTTRSITSGVAALASLATADSVVLLAQADFSQLAFKLAEYGVIAAVLAFVLWSAEKRLQRHEDQAKEREDRMAKHMDLLTQSLIDSHAKSTNAVEEFSAALHRNNELILLAEAEARRIAANRSNIA